ncbi:hypothetical protein BS78_10G000300 [Paspalum vaginatum]|nr:hypothetical protein BS78_10G000300 [Paspalum vaginatum]
MRGRRGGDCWAFLTQIHLSIHQSPIDPPNPSLAPSDPAMSSSQAAAAAGRRYYCHQCDRTVSIAPPASPDADVFCPLCAGGFVEELLDASPAPAPAPPSFDLRHPSDLSAFFGPPSPGPLPSGLFDASNFIHDHFGGLLSGGATIQIVLEGGGGGAAPALVPGLSLADYFMGPSGLEQLIQQLAENDPNRYGTPPAAKSAVAALPDVAVSAEMMQADGGAQCAVCMDDFQLGAAAKQLPCKHVFHKDCILPWLDLHSSCPVCRFELPTDDTDYSSHQHAAPAPAPAPAPAASSPTPRGVAERRFRISLPWPLRAALGAAQAESSNPPTNDGGSSDAGGGPHSQSGYDDLD